ncbi:MAG: GNAT family N-acetyltransferase [Firmicutes bacterium]|nr:GNAT family N-acetyltransferase [Bacillota bacterium]
MIRFAKKEDYTDIKKLWSLSFPEDPRFTEYFFENEFDFKNTLLYEEEKSIVSMLQRIYYTMPVERENRNLNFTYLYGCCTHPTYRNRGLFRQLLEKSHAFDRADGKDAAILIPANVNLFSFYEHLGFKKMFYVGDKNFDYVEDCIEIRQAKKEDIPSMMLLYDSIVIPHIQRRENYFKKQIRFYEKTGGKVFVCESGFAFVYNDGEKTECTELIAKDFETEKKFCYSIMKAMGTQKLHMCKPAYARPFGMIYPHKDIKIKKSYMNLMFN